MKKFLFRIWDNPKAFFSAAALVLISVCLCAATGSWPIGSAFTNPSYGTNYTEPDLKSWLSTNAAASMIGVSNATGTTFSVGGFTLVTNLTINTFRDSDGCEIAANGGWATNVQINNAVRSNNGTAILSGLTLLAGEVYGPPVTILICSAPLASWSNATNSLPALLSSELATNLQAVVSFAAYDYVTVGTNTMASKSTLNIGLRPMTNSLFLYFSTQGDITNTNSAMLKITLLQD